MRIADPHFADRFAGNLVHDLRVMGQDIALQHKWNGDVLALVARNMDTGRAVALEVHAAKPVPEEELIDYAAQMICRHTARNH